MSKITDTINDAIATYGMANIFVIIGHRKFKIESVDGYRVNLVQIDGNTKRMYQTDFDAMLVSGEINLEVNLK